MRLTRFARACMLACLLQAALLAGCTVATPSPRPALEVKLLAFNDFHGHLLPPFGGVIQPDPQAPGGSRLVPAGGVEYLASRVKALRAAHPHTVVVAAGDLIGATPLISGLFDDEPTVEAMNLIGLEFNAAGNHEFDRGIAALQRLQNGGCAQGDCKSGSHFEGARFKFLSVNTLERASGQPLLPPYGIKSFNGIRVAFIGATLKATPSLVPSAGIAGLEFVDEADAVNRLVPELRAQGVEAIVVLLHQGGSQRGNHNECEGFSGPVVDIARRLDPAVDVIVSGHTHQAYVCRLHGKLVTGAGAYGRLVTEIDLQIDAYTRDVKSARAVNHVVANSLPRDPALTALVTRYAALAAPIERRVVGRISEPISPLPDANGESMLGKLIADAHLTATADAGAQIAFMNPGGIRAPIAYKGGSDITYGELFAVHPFRNTLVTMTLTGAQILEMLEEQWLRSRPRPLYVSRGFSYAWVDGTEPGRRVDAASVTLNGKPLDPAARYRVTVNDFLAEGGDGFSVFMRGEQRVAGVTDIEAMAQYLERHSPVGPDRSIRVRRVERTP